MAEECTHLIVVLSGCSTYLDFGPSFQRQKLFMAESIATLEDLVAAAAASTSMKMDKNVHSIQRGNMLCEAAMWTRWFHRGELETNTCTTTLEIKIADFLKLLVRYPILTVWGREHGKKMVETLNACP